MCSNNEKEQEQKEKGPATGQATNLPGVKSLQNVLSRVKCYNTLHKRHERTTGHLPRTLLSYTMQDLEKRLSLLTYCRKRIGN